MIMGTAQKQNISCQHRYFNQRGNRRAVRPTPMTFQEWMQDGIRKYQKDGLTFELVTASLMRIRIPGKVPLLRTCDDFMREYREEYLSKF